MITFDFTFVIYFALGFLYTIYWWWYGGLKEEYDKEKVSDTGVDNAMTCLYLLSLVCFWPLVLIKKFVKWFMFNLKNK